MRSQIEMIHFNGLPFGQCSNPVLCEQAWAGMLSLKGAVSGPSRQSGGI